MTDRDKYKGKYRIPSARWAAWDYGSNAAYFVTICTAGRTNDFGRIANGVMTFTTLGESARDCWNAIPAHFPFVELDEFVIMPNHVHGIIIINKPDNVETQNIASLKKTNRFGPQSQNLASIIRGFKIGVTKFARQNQFPFTWQERYHDHVIRNGEEHERIRQYILANVENWAKDELYDQLSDNAQHTGVR